ncbi:MAG TPA: hypothetical protein VMW50_10040 [Dehalococcoidia bacterium]|nr:hypothetical protein [Dehalococcoidia bacterium]
MKKEALNEIDFYSKPTKYVTGKVDKTGIVTGNEITKLSELSADKLFVVGDTEEDFDRDYMEELEDIFDGGELIGESTLEFEEGDEDVVEPGITYIEVRSCFVDPVIGKIVKVWSEGPGGGEFATYFGCEFTYKAIERGALSDSDEPKIEDTEITLVIEKDILADLMTEFGSGSGVVVDQIKSDFRRMISKYYLG